ncbi:MAG TPA: hypothetical protein DDX39_12320 [Bacteroidales bacterium]|nr:MAG: hypothetical protein A2W98_11725 [Bacteroidetes bacterium GWF2_33_38]OFY76368.1 MAG: hypothetical protein A2265_02010 [Bacteroidetes bacterium RIFOXYA12_FULL_33_9]OFY88825.1 MAG: hypothetical protein A2236_08415 [Bacteroidetes bacterium RIFOXYA2_FULL_33_7]HBF89418.1 hypothetical protein [Bacteroidales bacterium]
MRFLLILLSIIYIFTLSSCVDIIEKTYWSEGNYYVTDNPGETSCKTLYYKIGNNDGIGRVDYVSKIGFNKNFIIVETLNNETKNNRTYWILNKEKDNSKYNANEIIEGLFIFNDFKKRTSELNILNILFTKDFQK